MKTRASQYASLIHSAQCNAFKAGCPMVSFKGIPFRFIPQTWTRSFPTCRNSTQGPGWHQLGRAAVVHSDSGGSLLCFRCWGAPLLVLSDAKRKPAIFRDSCVEKHQEYCRWCCPEVRSDIHIVLCWFDCEQVGTPPIILHGTCAQKRPLNLSTRQHTFGAATLRGTEVASRSSLSLLPLQLCSIVGEGVWHGACSIQLGSFYWTC